MTNQETPNPTSVSTPAPNGAGRREFIASAVSGVGFLLGFTIDAGTRATRAAGLDTSLNAYIRIGVDESITILFGGCEMGQGSMSGLAQIVAEDLMVDWSSVKIEQALASSISYLTGGSSAVRGRYNTLRKAGATVRDMLIAAAAKTWNVPATQCVAQSAKVLHTPTNRVLTYGALAALAATMPVPAAPVLVDPSKFRLIGKNIPRQDIPLKVNGKAIFGIDVRLPNMVYAVIKHCPTLGGTLAKTPTKPSGAIAVVPVTAPENRGVIVAGTFNAVAVVASNTWQARNLARNLSVSWNLPASASSMDSAAILTQANTLLSSGTPVISEKLGDAEAAIATAPKKLDFTYTFPYLAHATLEPLNCTASVTATSCEVWAPNQAAGWVLATAMAVTKLPADKVTIHTTFLGGGLGRKIEQDYVRQAVEVSNALKRPVKLTWTREEDFANDQYRPMAVVRVRAGFDGTGNILGFAARNVSPSILGQRGWIGPTANDGQASEGLTGHKYNFLSNLAEWVRHPSPIPVGFWRSVGHSINAYAVECMLDEIATSLKIDPLTYRKQLLGSDPKAKAVIDAADANSQWRFSLPTGHSWGVAFAESFGTLVCQVVEISAPTTTSIRVHRVTVAVDCGFAVNPGSVEMQMQGGIVHGLGSILWGQIPFKAGVSQVKNFSNYRVLKIGEMPQITVVPINSGTPTGGAGEPAVPPIGPAVANAYFKLTGKRVRTLPFFPGQSTMSD